MIKKILNILIFSIILPYFSFEKSEYVMEGINLYKENKLEDAKFKFEQDLVFNPKSELSYLYLSKIFNKQEILNLKNKI